jgi:hypothetical protein
MKTQKSRLILLVVLFWQLSTAYCLPWNEENTSQLGRVTTAHSTADVHSTIHYDLTKLLAIKAGFSPDMAESLARYCVLVDQINPKSNYPYPIALNNISIPDTYTGWDESLAGTERGSPQQNSYKEYPPQYWHFPFRDPSDSISGAMTFGIDYPLPADLKYREKPYYWRIPLLNNYNLNSIRDWALYASGFLGKPDNSCPSLIYFYNATTQQYEKVQPGSVQAMGIYLHSLADSYSHEHCMVTDTLRSHPAWSDACGLTYHSFYEFAYDTAIPAMAHATPCFQALWRALIAYKAENGITSPSLWAIDNNGFQDGDGIPDELENDEDTYTDETFLEKWIRPTDIDFNEDGFINHSDHTSWRIFLINQEIQPLYKILTLRVIIEGLYMGSGLLQQAMDENGQYFNGNIADNIIVELHDASNYSSIIFSDTIHLDKYGQATLFYPFNLNNSYFITVRHRNSISITSSSPIPLQGNFVEYNFCNNPASVYGNNLKMLSSGLYGLYSGDCNADGHIDQNDLLSIQNSVTGFSKGYLISDLNGDGITDASDLVIADNNAAHFVEALNP